MSGLPVGVQIYVLTALTVAVATHFLSKRYLIACGGSALLSPFVFAFVSYLHGDSLHLVEAKVFLFFAVIALGVALIAGLPFLFWRRRNGAYRM
jgi:membrane protein DedA with SNARE-associated domain